MLSLIISRLLVSGLKNSNQHKQTKGQKRMTNKMIKDLLSTLKLLKNYSDVQSKRIDLLEKRCKRLEDKENKNDKIFSRYQMTADSVEGVPFPEVEAKQ